MDFRNRNDRCQLPGQALCCRSAILILLVLSSPNAFGQQYWNPLTENQPPGTAAAWMARIHGSAESAWLQPIRLQFPYEAQVDLHVGSAEPLSTCYPEDIIAAAPGHLYRLRIHNIAGLDGAELYPSLELIDRLHPPAGEEDRFAIPVPISEEDIRLALSGRMVTRVIYLEQPQLAAGPNPLDAEIPQQPTAGRSGLAEADERGRPLLIMRLGGRQPSISTPSPRFYGTGGAAEVRRSTSARSGAGEVIHISGSR